MKDAQNARLGRDLKIRHMFTLAFGAVIGVSWITMLGHWIGAGGAVGAALAFVIGCLLMTLIALCYGEVSNMYPASGGEIVYSYMAFGAFGAFIVGWLALLLYAVVLTFLAVSLGWIVAILLPDLSSPIIYRIFGYDVTYIDLFLSLASILILAWLNAKGAKNSAAFQDFATASLVVVSVLFIGAGLLCGDEANLSPEFSGETFGSAARGVGAVLITTPFWYSGFNVVTQAIGERGDATSSRDVAIAMVLSIFAVMVFYVLLIISASFSLPRADLLALEMPAAEVFDEASSAQWLGKLVLVAGVLGVVTSLNAVYFAGARAVFALARTRLLPGALGVVESRSRTPARAIWFIGAFSIVTSLVGRGAIEKVVNVAGILFGALFLSVCLSFIRLRKVAPDRPRLFKAPGGVMTAALGAVLSLAIIAFSLWTTRPVDGAVSLEWSLIFVWSALGVVLWALLSRQRAGMNEDERRAALLDGDCETAN